MIDHIWTIACRVCTVDRDTNNVSLIEVLEQLAISSETPNPKDANAVPAHFEIVSLWGRA